MPTLEPTIFPNKLRNFKNYDLRNSWSITRENTFPTQFIDKKELQNSKAQCFKATIFQLIYTYIKTRSLQQLTNYPPEINPKITFFDKKKIKISVHFQQSAKNLPKSKTPISSATWQNRQPKPTTTVRLLAGSLSKFLEGGGTIESEWAINFFFFTKIRNIRSIKLRKQKESHL